MNLPTLKPTEATMSDYLHAWGEFLLMRNREIHQQAMKG